MSGAWKVFAADSTCKEFNKTQEWEPTARICYMQTDGGGAYIAAMADIVTLAGRAIPDSIDSKPGRFIVRLNGFREEIEMPTLEEAMALITIRYADTKGE